MRESLTIMQRSVTVRREGDSCREREERARVYACLTFMQCSVTVPCVWTVEAGEVNTSSLSTPLSHTEGADVVLTGSSRKPDPLRHLQNTQYNTLSWLVVTHRLQHTTLLFLLAH
jgi:hypothetical protein